MASLYLLIPVSLIFCALAVWIFFWAVNNGQYDDLEGEADRILFDDDDDDDDDEVPEVAGDRDGPEAEADDDSQSGGRS